MKAVLRGIRITPKKANLVAGMVRGKPVNEALSMLKFMPKKGARIIYKVVKSAASNAKNNFGQSIDDLVVSQIWAVKGTTLKRATPANRGRAWPILEHMSHITVEVGLREGAIPKKMPAKKGKIAEKPTEAKAETKVEKSSSAKATEASITTEKKAVAKKPSAKKAVKTEK
jgi:large subunit ribosomal protein L22